MPLESSLCSRPHHEFNHITTPQPHNTTQHHNTTTLKMAKSADQVVLVMGIDGSIEAEGHDRTETSLPGMQTEFIAQVLALGKPTVLVLVHGGALSLGPIKETAPAILDCFYGGEEAANAMYGARFHSLHHGFRH
jgi:beta-glucosidase